MAHQGFSLFTTARNRYRSGLLLEPLWATYACADGKRLYLVAPGHAAHERRALAVLGLADAARALGLMEAREKKHDTHTYNNLFF